MPNNPEDPEIPLDISATIARSKEAISRINDLMGSSARNTAPSVAVQHGAVSKPVTPKREPKFKPGLSLNQGKQVVKGYSVTEDQLDSLSLLGVIATACFSGAAGLLGFAVNLKSTLDLAVGAPVAVTSWWGGVNVSAAIASGILLIAGGIFYKKRFSKLRQIKNNTKFDGE